MRRVGALATDRREVTANHPRVAGDRFIRFIHRIASDDESAAPEARLRIDNSIASNHRRPACNTSSYIEVSEEDENAAGELTFNLN